MAGAVIGSLRVVLGADTAALEKGLKDSQAGLAKFGAAVASGMAAVATAAAAAGVAIGVAMKRTIDDADKLSKTSQKLGVPIEQLSALAYAADLSDVSFEELTKGVAKLSKTMVEAAAKPTSEAANAFRALGVSVKDSSGNLKSSEAVLGDVADKFAGLKDGAGKTAVSMALFGRAGADLIPLLNGGRDSLKGMNEEAIQFGAIIDAKTGKAAEAFNDNMTRLGYAIKGVVVQTTSQLLPTLVEISNGMVESAKNSGILSAAVAAVSASMKALVSGGVIVGAVFKALGEYIATVSGAISQVLKGEFASALATVKGGVSDVSTTATAAFGTIDRLWKGTAGGADVAATSTEKAATAQKNFNFAALGGKSAFDQFILSQQKSLALQQADFATTGLAAGAKERLRVVTQGLAVAQANNIVLTEAQRLKLTETAAAADLMALKLGNLALLGGESNPFIPIGLAIDATNAKLLEGGLKAQEYATLSGQAAQLTSKLWADSATSLGGSFENIGSSLSQMNDSWAVFAKAGQAIAATIAFVNAYVAASEAFAKTPFPANIAIAAGVLAKGIGMVAIIKSAVVPKFATGGSMTLTGTGGPDTVPVGLMASPGEQIDIWRPEQGGGADPRRGGGAVNIVNLSMPIATTRDALRSLIEGLNDMMSDGYQLNIKPA